MILVWITHDFPQWSCPRCPASARRDSIPTLTAALPPGSSAVDSWALCSLPVGGNLLYLQEPKTIVSLS